MTAVLVHRAENAPAPRTAPRRVRGSVARPSDRRLPAPRPAGTACTQPQRHRSQLDAQAAVYRRRRSVAGVAVGAALAGLVWFFAIVGGEYQASVEPAPSSTAVVHVRAGESLSAVASRVAPQMPVETVINRLVELNHLRTSGLTVGQALVAPVY